MKNFNLLKLIIPGWKWWANRIKNQLVAELEKQKDEGIIIPNATAQAMRQSLRENEGGQVNLSMRDLARFLKLIKF